MLRVSLLFVFAALGAAEVEEVSNQAQFQKILANNAAVAVDFYSTTCGPCIMIAPKYKEVRCKTRREPWREAAERSGYSHSRSSPCCVPCRPRWTALEGV